MTEQRRHQAHEIGCVLKGLKDFFTFLIPSIILNKKLSYGMISKILKAMLLCPIRDNPRVYIENYLHFCFWKPFCFAKNRNILKKQTESIEIRNIEKDETSRCFFLSFEWFVITFWGKNLAPGEKGVTTVFMDFVLHV